MLNGIRSAALALVVAAGLGGCTNTGVVDVINADTRAAIAQGVAYAKETRPVIRALYAASCEMPGSVQLPTEVCTVAADFIEGANELIKLGAEAAKADTAIRVLSLATHLLQVAAKYGVDLGIGSPPSG